MYLKSLHVILEPLVPLMRPGRDFLPPRLDDRNPVFNDSGSVRMSFVQHRVRHLEGVVLLEFLGFQLPQELLVLHQLVPAVMLVLGKLTSESQFHLSIAKPLKQNMNGLMESLGLAKSFLESRRFL